MRVEARPPTGQGHIVGARGFATHSGSVTICQITKIENNFHAQQRERQAESGRGGEWERAQPELRSDFCPGSAAIVFISSASLAQLHFTLKHLSLRALLLLLLPRSCSYIYLLSPPPPLAMLCLYSMRPDKQTFPCLRLQSACLSG